MGALSASDLASMRAAVAELFPDTCTILSVTTAPDGMGGVVSTWGTATASQACRADKMSGSEGVVGDSRQPFSGYVFSMVYNATITPANRIVFNGTTYAVTSVNEDQSWPVVKRVLAEEI